MTSFFKQPKIRCRHHLRYVASQPCMLCEGIEVQAHHLLRVDRIKGMATKSGDNWTVPLCFYHHDELHRHGDEIEFFLFYGWDYPAVKDYATELWECSLSLK